MLIPGSIITDSRLTGNNRLPSNYSLRCDSSITPKKFLLYDGNKLVHSSLDPPRMWNFEALELPIMEVRSTKKVKKIKHPDLNDDETLTREELRRKDDKEMEKFALDA